MDLLSSDVTGVVTWIGTILTIFGLAMTFREAASASRAAKSASREATQAELAVGRLERYLSLSDIVQVGAHLDQIVQLVSQDERVAAEIQFGHVRRSLRFISLRTALTPELSAALKRNISKVDIQIGYLSRGSDQYKPQVLRKSLAGLADFVTTIEHNMNSSVSGIGAV